MATTKNKKKKKSRRYLTRAARRTVAALLMISALIVAAIPATPSRAAEDDNYEQPAGAEVTYQDGNNFYYFQTTGTGNSVRLVRVDCNGDAKTSVNLTGTLHCSDENDYVCTIIGEGAFTQEKSPNVFDKITDVTAGSVEQVEQNAFNGCTALESYDGTSTQIVGKGAFANTSSFRNCMLAGTVSSIGDQAYYRSGLEVMPKTDSISFIGNEAFAESNIKSSITIPGPTGDVSGNTDVALGNNVFMGCTELQNVVFTGNYNSIGSGTFSGCVKLTNVTFPNGLANIGEGSFDNCVLLSTVNIPGAVQYLPSGLFGACTSLKEITLNNGPEQKAGEINDVDITGALPGERDEKFKVIGYRNIKTGSSTGYTKAYNYCFEQSITYECLDEDSKGVADKYFDITSGGALVNCNVTGYVGANYGTNEIVIPDTVGPNNITVTSLGPDLFKNAGSNNIKSVTIPLSVTYIASGTFSSSNLKYLEYVIMQDGNKTVVEDDDSTFPTDRSGFFIYGDISRKTTDTGINAYEYAAGHNIEFRGPGNYGEEGAPDVSLVVGNKKGKENILTGVVIGSDDNDVKTGTAVTERPGVSKIKIADGIKGIDEKLFASDTGLTAISAESSTGTDGVAYGLETLSDLQFAHCANLASVSLPSTLYDVGKLPFKDCEKLVSDVKISGDNPWCAFEGGVLYAPVSGGTEGEQASGADTLTAAPDAASNYRIAEMLEYSDTKLYTIPATINGKTVDEISEEAFSNNQNLQSFSSTGSNVSVIPMNCFNGAIALARITLADNITNVEEGAFQNLGVHNNKQPVFRVNSGYVVYDDKKKVFDYEGRSDSDLPYYFYSTAKGDTTYTICGVGSDSGDTKDNLYWKGLVSQEEEIKRSLSSCKIYYNGNKSSDGSYGIRKYTGSDISWVPGNLTDGDFYVVDGDTVLYSGTHYNMQTINPTPKAKGNYSFVLTGTGDYEGTLTGTFVINDTGNEEGGDDPTPTPTPTPTDTGDFVTDFSYDGPGFFKWTGSTIMPQNIVVRSASNNDIILTKNVDYTISYGDSTHDNKSMGINMGLVTITGINNYKGKTGKSYFSIKKSLSENIVGSPTPPGKTIDVTISNGVYDSNNAVSANIVLIDRTTGKTLTEGVDYTVTCTKISGKNQAIATITGMGDYYYDTYVSSRFAITKKKSSSSGSTSSSSGSSSSSSSSSGSSSSSSGSSSSSSSGSSSSSSSAGSSSAGGNYSRNTTSGSTVTRTSGGTVRAATDDELANLLQAAHIDAINGGTADGYQVRISKTDSAESAFSQALVNRYGSLDNVRYYSMDIELLDENGNYVDSSGVTVTMTLPLPDSLASYGANNRVATVDGSGNLEDLGVTYSMLQGRECATFVAPHFSPYGFYVDVANLDYGVMDSTPKTGDPISPKWFFSLGLAALSIFLFLKKDPKPKANPA